MINWISKRLSLTPDRRQKLWYLPILAASMALMMVRLLAMARLLSVEEFGFFSIGILVSSTFSMSGCFGLQVMLQRDAPGLYLRGNDRQVAVLTIQSSIVALFIFVVGLLVVEISVRILAVGGLFYLLGIFHGLSQQMFLIATLESRSRGDVVRFATQNLLRSATIFLISFAIAYRLESAAALLIAEAAVTILFALYLIRVGLPDQSSSRELIKTAWANLPHLNWRIALMLLGASMYTILLSNGDRWIASSILSLSQFAQYSFVWIILAIAQSAQAVMNAAVFPFVSRRYAVRGTRAAFTACVAIAGGIGLLLTVLSVPAFFLMKFAIGMWYPAYIGVIPLIPVFICIAILRMSDFWSTFMLVSGLEKKLVFFNSLSLVLVVFGVIACYAAGILTHIDGLKVAYLALAINLVFVGTTAIVSFVNRSTVH